MGFSLLELLVVVLILGIVTTFAIIGIARARASFNLSNNADVLKAYIEKAFADARRRHALGNARATVRVTGLRTYQVSIDFDGDGNPETRSIDLTDRVQFVYDPAAPPQATIDWRGKVSEGTVNFTLKSSSNESVELSLSGAGDSSIDPEFAAHPTITVTPTSSDVRPSVVVSGNTVPNPNVSPTAASTPLPFCTSNQLPATNNCRCQPGQIIDDKGKCKTP